jgi:hypothetical protein
MAESVSEVDRETLPGVPWSGDGAELREEGMRVLCVQAGGHESALPLVS